MYYALHIYKDDKQKIIHIEIIDNEFLIVFLVIHCGCILINFNC